MSVTHVTGPVVTVDDRWLRQRCAWCGELLVSYDFERTAGLIGTNGELPERPGGFEERVFLTKDGGMMWTRSPEEIVASGEDPHRYPDDACLNSRTVD